MPTFECLKEIAFRQPCSIPFENLDVLAGRRIEVDSESIRNKLVGRARGGYCFECNGLLLDALLAIGFEATPLSARVRVLVPPGTVAPLTHMTIKVVQGERTWLVDSGFGGFSPTAPIDLESDQAQETPHNCYRLHRDGTTTVLQIWSEGEWMDGYALSGIEMTYSDRVVGNWYTSTHPNSHFRMRPFCSKANEDGSRVNVLGDKFTWRRGHEVLETRTIETRDTLKELLRERFSLELDEAVPFLVVAPC